MLNNSMLQVGTEDIKWIISTVLTIVGFIIALIKLWQSIKDRMDTKLDSKADKSDVDKKFEGYEAHNSKSYARMEANMTMIEQRSIKAYDDLREDYVRGNEALSKRLDDIKDLLVKMMGK